MADACSCGGPWPAFQEDTWAIFNASAPLGEMMEVLGVQIALDSDQVDHGTSWPTQKADFSLGSTSSTTSTPSSSSSSSSSSSTLRHLHQLITGEGGAGQCSVEHLPILTPGMPVDCPAGMMHWMLLCAIQMWLRHLWRQSALYFEHALTYLALSLECLSESQWPLWPGQVLENWELFLEGSFPAGALKVEQKMAEGEDGEPDVHYDVAGPQVELHSFKWKNGPRKALYCPPRGSHDEDISQLPAYFGASQARSVKERRPHLTCAVPLVWPAGLGSAEVILETYGGSCDLLAFFLAGEEASVQLEAEEALKALAQMFQLTNPVLVVDLARHWKGMIPDSIAALSADSGNREEVSGVNQKDLLLFEFIDSSGLIESTDWVCRIETDSYFAPSNFRRFVAERGLSPSEPWFIGSLSYWHIHFEPRIVFNEQVQTVSQAAVRKLAALVRRAPWSPRASYSRCEVVPGHRGDLMLALCLSEAGVPAYRDVVDAQGREFFLNYRMEQMRDYDPRLGIGMNAPDPRAFATDAVMHWKGKAHFFMPCLGKGHGWISPYPISFHNYKDPEGIRWVHAVLSGQIPCGIACHDTWLPGLADDDFMISGDQGVRSTCPS